MSSELEENFKKKYKKSYSRTVSRFKHDAPKNWEFQEFYCDFLMATNPNRVRCRHYNSSMFKRDLHRLFDYLPASEIERMYQAFCWLIREGWARWGRVYFKELFHLMAYDFPLSSAYENLGLKVVGTRKEFVKKVQLVPTRWTQGTITPLTHKYFLTHDKGNKCMSLTKAMGYSEAHAALGRGLIQKVFDNDFAYLGYNEEYQELIDKKLVAPFGKEYKDGVDDYTYDNSDRLQEVWCGTDYSAQDETPL